ncbi:ABC transporter permease/M1 family aminopeptidase [Aureibaculum conchae]|uniref:ABC transporter permease/M1 family aminopeptidase n=1 Tax=Aureibaculum sp. 2308TA14-22 TaxID=3108392 RepID=UPI0033936A95
MTTKIYSYELKYWLKKPTTYIYIFVFFAFALVTMLGTGGFFDGPSTSTKQLKHLNSPLEINSLLQFFNKFFMFLLPAIIGTTIYRDYKSRIHNILYSFPIRKRNYLFGKFLSGFSIVALISLFVIIALFIGEQMLGVNNPKIGEFNMLGYLSAYFIYTLPNLFFYGLLVFMGVAITRNIYTGFVIVIVLFLIQIIIENLLIGNSFLIALLDPFAQNTTLYETKMWTLSDKNSKLIPISGVVLYNRLFWMVSISILFILFYKKFALVQEALSFRLKKAKGLRMVKNNFQSSGKVYVSKVKYNFSFWNQLNATFKISNLEFKYIFKNPLFYILAVFGMLTIVFILTKVTNKGDLILLPVTRIMISGPAFFYTMVVTIITFLFSGMLVHRAKTSRMDQLIDMSPISNWSLMLSKVVAIIKIQFVLLVILMFCGIAIQIYNNYFHFELGLYTFHLFVVIFPILIVWAFTSVFMHTLIPKLYLSLFILIIGLFSVGSLDLIGIDTNLLKFNTPPKANYSDLNGYGNGLFGHTLVQMYWFVFGCILMILSYLLWKRGITFSFKERVLQMKARFTGKIQIFTSIFLTAFITLGLSIYKSEGKIQFSQKKQNAILSNFHKKFDKYKNIKQPKITAVKINMNIFPRSNTFNANGTYTIVNNSEKNIDTLLIKTGFDENTNYTISESNKVLIEDKMMQFKVHVLKKPLVHHDTLTLNFDIENKENSVFERNSSALKNGTYILNDALPRLEYIGDEFKKHPSDSTVTKYHYTASDSDLVDFEAIISTSADQIAIAPGYLQKKWKENGRSYFHYKMNKKIKFLFAFNSGKFEIKKEKHKGVNLEIYHHKNHNYNNDKIIDGLKAAIDYNTKYFSDYQHQEARVIEFPLSEGTYATTMANSIPMSEVRFIINSNGDTDKMDLSFYMPAHELTHQWWGNQVVSADALGAKMLTESITEYISYKIYKKYFGEEKGMSFLKFQRSRYLRGRTREDGTENPLYLVNEDQMYISYGKGTIAFNTLSHYLGEENLNKILKNFLDSYKFRTNKYPTSIDLINELKTSVPKNLQYLIIDMFETITFYENKINSAKMVSRNKEKFTIEVDLEVLKYRNGNVGAPLKLNDYIELGFYTSSGKLISIEKKKIMKANSKLFFQLDVHPSKVILDPNYLVIDKNIDDNHFEL